MVKLYRRTVSWNDNKRINIEYGGNIMSETKETMKDFEQELEASYKIFDEKKNTYVEQEGPNAEAWSELLEMMANKVISKVKIKEAVKAGVVAYIGDIKGFIPASHVSTQYVEKLDDLIGTYVEVVPITVEPENQKLVLSARVVLKEKEQLVKAEKLAAVKVGEIVKGKVDSLKDYGAFVLLESGLSGLLHISQISNQRIKHPGAVLKEGQEITAKIIGNQDGKISLSMKVLEEAQEEEVEVFDYNESGIASTGLGDLLKGIKL